MPYQSEDRRLSFSINETIAVAQAQLHAVEGKIDWRRTAALKHVIRHLENAKRDAKLAYNDKPLPEDGKDCYGNRLPAEDCGACLARPGCAAAYEQRHATDGVVALYEGEPPGSGEEPTATSLLGMGLVGRDPIVESKLFADGRVIDW